MPVCRLDGSCLALMDMNLRYGFESEHYFIQYRIGNEQRVDTTALYLNDAAKVWYQSVILSGGMLTWIEFKEELISRFREIVVEDVVEEFNKLQNTGTIDEFFGKFEDLKAHMLIRNPIL